MKLRALSSLVLLCAAACTTPTRREDVRIPNGDVTLAGTLVGPATSGRHPGVVLLHGSGPDGRDNPAYWLLADAFVKRGFVVLVYDKRGNGRSTGDWRTAPFSAVIDDATAAVKALRRHPWVDSTRIGVWGGSEGAAIAPEVALREAAVDFVIMQSSPGVTFAEQNLHQTRLQAEALTSDSAARTAAMRMHALRQAYARSGEGWSAYDSARRQAEGQPWAPLAVPAARDNWWWAWYRTKMDYTPIPSLARLRVPVLAVWGSEDRLIPVETSRNAFVAARREANVRGDSLVVIEGASHTLHIDGLRGVLRRGLRNRPVASSLMAAWACRQVGCS